MGGTILEFSADKYYEAGKAEGRAEGMAEGEQKVAKLVMILIAKGESDELARAVKDKKYLEYLFRKYAIT